MTRLPSQAEIVIIGCSLVFLVQFALTDPGPQLYHNEPIYRDGVPAGLTSSAPYGHHLGSAVALGYVRHSGGVTSDFIPTGKWEIGVGLELLAAKASIRPMYDPASARMKT